MDVTGLGSQWTPMKVVGNNCPCCPERSRERIIKIDP